MPGPLTINGTEVRPGERRTLDLPVARLYTHTPVTMPVHAICGKQPGARLFVSAAIHGDEINGVEIIRRLIRLKALDALRGALIAVPIVNVHGFIARSRYLPDRRDLNRVFPGSETGSLAARLAHLFMQEIASQCTHGIDIHTAAMHRCNLPQIRADLQHDGTRLLAETFGVPVLLSATARDGSLRQAAVDRGITMLLYEAGEALRFDEPAIRVGVRGILAVMRALGMLPGKESEPTGRTPVHARSSTWVRAAGSGVLRARARLGTEVHKGSVLGTITDPFGESEIAVTAPVRGILIGRVNLPLVNEGEALFHIARPVKPQIPAGESPPQQEAREAELATAEESDSPGL